MTNKSEQQGKWVTSTSVALTFLTAAYFLFLFPREATSLLEVYINYFFAVLIVSLAVTLTFMLYNKHVKSRSSTTSKQTDNYEKIVAQIIWRNRYVLQSKKSNLLYEPSMENRAKWDEIKKNFADEYVYLTIPEDKFSLNKVSQLIEKSFHGTAIGSIKPPTYSVKNIH